ncbi:ubiquitin-related modifier 1 [Lipomyces oligophaga]|uniref:ubiquitin-related modifier 1 n=1 Tax=Lipomyces oligophaga TaxID=45792 RepID=UPI0034CF6309
MPEFLVKVEFSGGLESLFSGNRQLKVPVQDNSSIADLVKLLCESYMTDVRRELFVIEGFHVRPGILVLINDADWELEGEEEYILQAGDQILFTSTLHGG